MFETELALIICLDMVSSIFLGGTPNNNRDQKNTGGQPTTKALSYVSKHFCLTNSPHPAKIFLSCHSLMNFQDTITRSKYDAFTNPNRHKLQFNREIS